MIVDVEATRSIRQAEVGSVRTMLGRVKDKFDLHPERLIADTAYGSGRMRGWLVDRKIAPHIPVMERLGAQMARGLVPTSNGMWKTTNTSAQRVNR